MSKALPRQTRHVVSSEPRQTGAGVSIPTEKRLLVAYLRLAGGFVGGDYGLHWISNVYLNLWGGGLDVVSEVIVTLTTTFPAGASSSCSDVVLMYPDTTRRQNSGSSSRGL